MDKNGNNVLNVKKKKLAFQAGDKKNELWETYELPYISTSLSPSIYVTKAQKLKANTLSKICFQGQTHGTEYIKAVLGTWPNARPAKAWKSLLRLAQLEEKHEIYNLLLDELKQVAKNDRRSL